MEVRHSPFYYVLSLYHAGRMHTILITCLYEDDKMCCCKTGPAGTGKTESVKALGHQMGRFVLVFNCDETFDFQVSDCLAHSGW